MRRLGLIVAGILLASSAFAYTGSGGVWAMKSGDFVAKSFAGTQTGIQAALDYVAGGGLVNIAPGTYTISAPVTIGANTTLYGAGESATILKADVAFSGTALVMNADTTGGMQWCSIENMTVHGNSENGANVPRGILFKGIGQPTRIRDVKVTSCAGVGIWREGIASNASSVEIINTTSNNSGDQNILITGYSGATSLIDVTAENPGVVHSGSASIYVDGITASFYPVSIWMTGIHCERLDDGEACVGIDNTHGVLLDGAMYHGSGSHGTMLQITGTAANTYGIVARGLVASNAGMQYMIDDQTYGRQYTAATLSSVDYYSTDGGTYSLMNIKEVNATELWAQDSLGVGQNNGGSGSTEAALVARGKLSGKSYLLLQRGTTSDVKIIADGGENLQVRHGLTFSRISDGAGMGYVTTGGLWYLGASNVTPTHTLEVKNAATIGDSLRVGNIMYLGSVAFASLGTPGNAAVLYCTDCDPASTPCASAGAKSGALAVRQGGAWKCF